MKCFVSRLLADSWERIADKHIYDAGAAELRFQQNEAGGLRPNRADDGSVAA